MRVSPTEHLDQRLTIINKLDAKDATLKTDAYYKTEVVGVWSAKTVRSVSSGGDVAMATDVIVQVPDTTAYLPYREWKNDPDRGSKWTMREGDYVVRGEVNDDISTATALKKAMAAHEPDAVQIQSVRDTTRENGLWYSNAGVMRYATGLFAEGA